MLSSGGAKIADVCCTFVVILIYSTQKPIVGQYYIWSTLPVGALLDYRSYSIISSESKKSSHSTTLICI